MTHALAWGCALVAETGLLVQLGNLRWFPRLRAARTERERSVVACVAMRNEARNARACLDALLAQPELRAVVVCDDGSDDGTRELLERMAAEEPRVVLAANANARSKSSALAAAAGRARELACPYLLFTDADVRFERGALAALTSHLQHEGTAAVTAWPRVRVRGAGDVLLSPLVTLLLLQALPMWRSRRGDPRFTAGNGQIFLVERGAYDACGGHAAIDAIVEDVALAKALVRMGAAVGFASAADVAHVDGYGSFEAAARGLGRSLFAASGVAGCTLFALWQLCACVLPLLLLNSAKIPAIAAATGALGARVLLARRMRQSYLAAVLTPLSGAAACAAALWTAVRGVSGSLYWRGRAVRG